MKASGSSSTIALYLLLIGIAFAFYFNSIPNQLALDDTLVLSQNKFVKQGVSGIDDILLHDSFYGATGRPASQLSWRYRPLSLISFAVEYTFFKENWTAYHFISVLMYGILCCVIFHFLRRWIFSGDMMYAFGVTIFFLIMPVHTEVVANIKSRDEIYALLFSVMFLHRMLLYVGNRQTSSLILACTWLLLAMAGKESAIILIVIAPLLDYVMQPSSTPASAISRTWIFPLVAGVFVAWRVSISSVPETDNSVMNNPYILATISQKWATIVYVLGCYLQNLFLPPYLSYDYGFNHIAYKSFADPAVLLSLATTLLLMALSVYGIIKRKLYGAFFAAYLIGIFLMSNAVLQVGPIMADRFLFAPSFFFAVGLGLMLIDLMQLFPALKLKQVSAGIVVLLTVISWNQVIARNADWKNNRTLYFTDLKRVPESVRALTFCGITLVSEADAVTDSLQRIRQLREAVNYFERAYKIYPDYYIMYQDWGGAYVRLNNMDSAIWAWDRQKVLRPDSRFNAVNDDYILRYKYNSSIARYNAALPRNNYRELLEIHRETMSYKNDTPDSWLLLGKLYYVNGLMDSSAIALRKFLLMEPENKEAQDLLKQIPVDSIH